MQEEPKRWAEVILINGARLRTHQPFGNGVLHGAPIVDLRERDDGVGIEAKLTHPKGNITCTIPWFQVRMYQTFESARKPDPGTKAEPRKTKTETEEKEERK